MIGKLPPNKTGGLNVSSITESQIGENNPPPTRPADTCISSSTEGVSPLANASVDTKLNALLELVKKTVGFKHELDKEETWLMEEGNTIRVEENTIDEKQQELDFDLRKYAFEDREKNVKRDHETNLDDIHVIDQKLTHPDYDDEDDDVGGTLVGGVGNR